MIDSVPLIQNPNDAQQINASIIAMKKASRELNEKIVKLNSLNSELDKKIALLDSGLNKEIEDRKEAINSLDVPSVGGSGKYISAISETDGKISATAGDITSTVSSGNSQPVTSGAVADAIQGVISLPTDAVLHYSFDELPDSPETAEIIIDNANGQNNAVNNGGIATKGVSGKGAYFLNGKYADLGTNFNLTPNFTLSVWVKPANNTNNLNGTILLKSGVLRLANGMSNNNNSLLFTLVGDNSTLYSGTIGGLLSSNVWTHLVITRSNTKLNVYLNGLFTRTQSLADSTVKVNNNSFLIGEENITRPQSYDDLLIFDRALSDTEVLALYQNKANTPKYFPIPTNDIKQNSLELATSGGVFNEINKCQKKFSAFVTGNGSYIDITPTENIENYIVNFGYSSTRYANVGIIYFLNVNGVITVNYKDLVKTQSFVTSPSVELLADGKFRFTHNFGDGSASLIVKV